MSADPSESCARSPLTILVTAFYSLLLVEVEGALNLVHDFLVLLDDLKGTVDIVFKLKLAFAELIIL